MRLAITLLGTITAAAYIYSGYLWVSVGFGLHPFVAFPVAVLCALAVYFANTRVSV